MNTKSELDLDRIKLMAMLVGGAIGLDVESEEAVAAAEASIDELLKDSGEDPERLLLGLCSDLLVGFTVGLDRGLAQGGRVTVTLISIIASRLVDRIGGRER